MHNVYIIPNLTGEEQFRKDAYTRLREGEGFTMFHYHHAEMTMTFRDGHEGPMPIDCIPQCRLNDPYPGHLYIKSGAGIHTQHPDTCAVYNQLDPMFFKEGDSPALGHCLDCHCSCYSPESDLGFEDECHTHGAEGCPACRG